MGEATLRHWASEVGAAANPAFVDRKGWDFVLEFPQAESSDSPLDLRPPEISCLVQVKTTASDRQRRSIRLDHWERLVKYPLPAFYLVIVYGRESNDVKEAYLVHIGKKWTEKVLKRLRMLGPNADESIRRKTLDLTWSDRERIMPLNGLGLEAAIRSYIGDRLDTYVNEKAQILQDVGDITPVLITFSMVYEKRDDLMNDWVDLAIGLRDSIDVSGIAIKENIRFGIPASTVRYDEGGTLWVVNRTKEATDVRLVIRNSAASQRSILAAKLHTPHHFFPTKPIPKEYFKARVVFSIGEVVIHTHSRTVSLRVNFPEAKSDLPLQEHAELWRIARILHEAKENGCVLEIQANGKPSAVFPLEVTQIQQIDPPFIQIARAVESAWYLASFLQIPPDTPVSLDQLYEQRLMLERLRGICDINFSIDAVVGWFLEEMHSVHDECALAIVKRLRFGEREFLISIGLAGPLILKQEETANYSFEVRKPRRIYVKCHYLSSVEDGPSTESVLEETVNTLEEKGYFVIKLGDPIDTPPLGRWIAASCGGRRHR